VAKPRDTEIRLALFGQNGAGKSTLLASYFGNQQRNAFEEKHGYRLEAEDAAAGNELLQRYYGMEQGQFPPGTDRFYEHRFALMVKMQPRSERAFGVIWYDYPGGWWERTPRDEAEQRARLAALEKLVSSHVGILLIDGAKYQREGISYVRGLLDHFKNEVTKLAPPTPGAELPRQWIIAVSKADLLAPGTTAERVGQDVRANASDQLKGLAAALGADGFGRRFLLLSAAQGDGARVMDAHRYIGLSLVVPLGLAAILEVFANKADTGARYRKLGRLLEKLRGLLRFVDTLDDILPRRYQALTILLRLLEADQALGRGATFYAEKQQEAVRRGQALKAAAFAMAGELASHAAKGVYYEAVDARESASEQNLDAREPTRQQGGEHDLDARGSAREPSQE
jgi:hypothetical protein